MASTALYGGVECGGQSFVVSIGEGHPTNIIHRLSIVTTTPNQVVEEACNFLAKFDVCAIGLASFGPVDIDTNSKTYGFITTSPKEQWRGFDILGAFRRRFKGVPIGFNTDVQAAALGELHHGNHGKIHSCCYVTVGTGIGVGVVTHNVSVNGLTHTEGGHIRVVRHPKDDFKGVCEKHKDCLEGLANSAALAARAKITMPELKDLPDDHPVWEFQAHYMAQLCATLTLLCAPQVIVLGGGVMRRRSLLPRIRTLMVESLNGYVAIDKVTKHTDSFIVSSRFDHGKHNNAGSVGALQIAVEAFSKGKPGDSAL